MSFLKIRLSVTIILFFLLHGKSSCLFPQNISFYESRLTVLTRQLESETAVLDSLKNVLDKRAKEINGEKRKPGFSENTVKEMMSASVSISNKIDEEIKNQNNIINEIEKVKSALSKKYSTTIDSLAQLEKSNNYSGSKETLRNKILSLTERKILAAPKIYSLNYNPEKILSLNLSSAGTEQEKKIFEEYLNNALSEVNSKLQQVKNLAGEVKQIVSLQKKTKKFIEDVDFGSEISRSSIVLRRERNTRDLYSNGTTTSVDLEYLTPQAQIYVYMLSQLDLKSNQNIKAVKHNYDEKKMTLQEYSELLSDVEKLLDEYRAVLSNKIKSGK